MEPSNVAHERVKEALDALVAYLAAPSDVALASTLKKLQPVLETRIRATHPEGERFLHDALSTVFEFVGSEIGRSKLRKAADPIGLLSVITRRRVVDEFRRERRDLVVRAALEVKRRGSPDPAEMASLREQLGIALEAVSKLGPNERLAVEMYLSGVPPRIIATEMGFPRATVRSWLHRGLKLVVSTLTERAR